MSLYLTAIIPPPDLTEEIEEIRQELSGRYKVYKALRPPVHITLFRPVNLEDDQEEQLIRWLRPVSFLHSPFEQQLENYDSFNNRVMYIGVKKNELLSRLQKDVASVFHKNRIDPKELPENSSFKPHITMAYRDVTPEAFRAIWEEYKNKKLKRKFTIDRFTLLKHYGGKWNVLKEFPLQKREIPLLF